MNKSVQNALNDQMAPQISGLLTDTYKQVQSMPEMMHGIMLMNAANTFSEKMKGTYPMMVLQLKLKFGEVDLKSEEYESAIDDIVHDALSKYITNLPAKGSKAQKDEDDYYGDDF
ncbi:hypothetical protein [Dyadobacter chenhuakuii]|uniref:Uncharacterized protein n=1 Tax=Dyadobacter chenhuakuii TaxID=2909339 RepID=A0A9X1TVV3_9BACT|nr:hypothetical protein [Dyadobacter chenhuakuii]MCF2501685.1 hypothetical protein [Dyadobacter chenhuakuii]